MQCPDGVIQPTVHPLGCTKTAKVVHPEGGRGPVQRGGTGGNRVRRSDAAWGFSYLCRSAGWRWAETSAYGGSSPSSSPSSPGLDPSVPLALSSSAALSPNRSAISRSRSSRVEVDHRRPCAGVPHPPHQLPHGRPGLSRVGVPGVPEVMEVNVLQAHGRTGVRPVLREVAPAKLVAAHTHEHETVRSGGSELVQVAPQVRNDQLRQGDGPVPRLGLGLALVQPAHVRDGLAHPHRPSVQVQVPTPQTGQLAPPHTAERRQQDQ